MDRPAAPADTIFRDLAPEQLAQVERSITIGSFPAGQLFFAPDELGDRLFLLYAGRVRLYKLSPEGRVLTLAVLEPPAVFGEMSAVALRTHDSFAEALSECVIGTIGYAELRRAMERYPAIALRLMELMSQRLQSMESKLTDIAFKSVPQRLATVLLSLMAAPPYAGPPALVRYTHQQLAEMIGSYRETVTKAVGEFRDAGLIRVEEDTIYLTDLPRLQALAGR